MRQFTDGQKARRAENLLRWRAANRERYRQTTHTWEARDGNAERMKQVRREWHTRNRERVNALARARYAANPELGRSKLKQKRQRAGVKYRQQVKRSRVKVRSTPEGRIIIVSVSQFDLRCETRNDAAIGKRFSATRATTFGDTSNRNSSLA